MQNYFALLILSFHHFSPLKIENKQDIKVMIYIKKIISSFNSFLIFCINFL
jgi:hypothetical protein